jgi:hypothetical protein
VKRNKTRQQRWKEAHPWVRYVEYARRRCADSDPRGPWYVHYYAKGIRVELTAKDLEPIWHRDGAAKMRKPSLDRIDEDGHYTPDNVRFVEFNWNARRAWDPRLEEVTPEFV